MKINKCLNCSDEFIDKNELLYCNKPECRNVLMEDIHMIRTLSPCPMNSEEYINNLLKDQDDI